MKNTSPCRIALFGDLANGRPAHLDALAVALHKTLRSLRASQPKSPKGAARQSLPAHWRGELRWCIHQTQLPPFLL